MYFPKHYKFTILTFIRSIKPIITEPNLVVLGLELSHGLLKTQ